MTALLLRELEYNTGKKLVLKINNNRSTMLSVRWESDCTKVSLHRMFLQAPRNVLEALVCYLKKEEKIIPRNVRFFIEENLKKLDYSDAVDRNKLTTCGTIYNLQSIYNRLNKTYFNDRLNLHITWFGESNRRKRTKLTFGLYHDPIKLIKIHRMLDNKAIPEYVIEYVVFHEMLHNVCPSYRDEKGIHRIHSKEFKKMEKEYRDYQLAKKWIKEHRDNLFNGSINRPLA